MGFMSFPPLRPTLWMISRIMNGFYVKTNFIVDIYNGIGVFLPVLALLMFKWLVSFTISTVQETGHLWRSVIHLCQLTTPTPLGPTSNRHLLQTNFDFQFIEFCCKVCIFHIHFVDKWMNVKYILVHYIIYTYIFFQVTP